MQNISLKLLGIAIATLLVLCGFQVITPLNNTASAVKDKIVTTDISHDILVTPTYPQPGDTVTFDLTIEGCTPTNIFWDFDGDGNWDDSGKMKTAHVYAEAGTYYFSYNAPYGNGKSTGCNNMIIHIGASPGLFSITTDIKNPIEGELVTFTPHIADYVYSVGNIVWTWGDGTDKTFGANPKVHNYTENGEYNGRVDLDSLKRDAKTVNSYKSNNEVSTVIYDSEEETYIYSTHDFIQKTEVSCFDEPYSDIPFTVYILKLNDPSVFYLANSYLVGQNGKGFTGDTLITMKDGSQKKISEVNENDEVRGFELKEGDLTITSVNTVENVYSFECTSYYMFEAEDLGAINAIEDTIICCPEKTETLAYFFTKKVYDNEQLADEGTDSAIEDINSGTDEDESGMNNKIESAFENIQNLYNEFCDGPDNYDLFDIFKNSDYNGIVGGDSVASRLNKLMSNNYLRDPKKVAVGQIKGILKNKQTNNDYAESFNFAKENIKEVDDFRDDFCQGDQELIDYLSGIEAELDNTLTENSDLKELISFIEEEIENSDENNDGGGITNGQMIAWLLYTFFMGGLITSILMPVALVVGAVVSLVVSIALVILLKKVGVSQMIGSYLNDITAQIPYVSDIIDADDWYLIVSVLAGMVIFGGTFAAIIALKPLQFVVGGMVSDAIVFVLFTAVSEIAKLFPDDSSNPRPIDRHPMLENMPILNTILYRLFDRNPATFLILKRIFGYVPA